MGYMDALGALSGDSEDSDSTGDGDSTKEKIETTTTTTSAKKPKKEIDYDALRRQGFRGGPSVRHASTLSHEGPTNWGKGKPGGTTREAERYTREESEATRWAISTGLDETCAKALKAAKEKNEEREREREVNRAAMQERKDRHLAAKQALRDDDRAKREAEKASKRRQTPSSSRPQLGSGFSARKRLAIDLSEDNAPAKEKPNEKKDWASEEKRLLEQAGSGFGFD
jgi:hypothetical protein